jgi:hypothetical protein
MQDRPKQSTPQFTRKNERREHLFEMDVRYANVLPVLLEDGSSVK